MPLETISVAAVGVLMFLVWRNPKQYWPQINADERDKKNGFDSYRRSSAFIGG
jgi:hypothetical protein